MYSEPIQLKNVTKNNLKQISLSIPKGKLIAFTGISGSGKSSLVFDTLAQESRRQFSDMMPMYLRNKMERFEQPEAESIENLTPAVMIDQKPLAGNKRSTVSTITDIAPLMRLLFSRIGTPSAGHSNHYSFNDPEGACPVCDGLGEKLSLDMDKLFDKEKSLEGGAIQFKPFSPGNWQFMLYRNSGLFDMHKSLKHFSEKEWHNLLYGETFPVQIAGPNSSYRDKGHAYEGMVDRFNRLYINRDISHLSNKNQSEVQQILSVQTCPQCHGDRLNERALASKIKGYNIADLSNMEIIDLFPIIESIEEPKAKSIQPALIKRLRTIENIGLSYIRLSRQTDTLSGGESQRVKMVRHLGSDLSNLTYILDEPSIGLHPHDVSHLADSLEELRDKGNTVIVVEHEPAIIRRADLIYDMGPGAGVYGGKLLFSGNYEELLEANTQTGKSLQNKLTINRNARLPEEFMSIEQLNVHNLKNVSVRFPKNVLTAVSGVAGSGKSSLVKYGLVDKAEDVIVVNQKGIGTSTRSTPATYIGVMDDIRKILSKEFDVSAGLFSFNSTGACPVCGGTGELKPDMAFADPVAILCENCGGTRFNDEARGYYLKEKTIVDILNMTIDEALNFFENKKIQQKIRTLYEVGAGYLTLGQSTNTLSGGEAQRIKLASKLYKNGQLYILDEPTTGLHPYDVRNLMKVLNNIVERGNSVVIIEHNLAIIAQSDWVIDLGPKGGRKGGEILYSGPVKDFLGNEESVTARYLREQIV